MMQSAPGKPWTRFDMPAAHDDIPECQYIFMSLTFVECIGRFSDQHDNCCGIQLMLIRLC